jgi:hypothetical protein
VLLTQLGESGVQPGYTLVALLVELGVIGSRQSGEPVAGHFALFDGMHAAAGKAAALVDKEVVHDLAEPRSWLVDFDEIIEFAVGLNKEFLKEVFSLSLLAGEAPCEPIQAVEVWPYEIFERDILV